MKKPILYLLAMGLSLYICIAALFFPNLFAWDMERSIILKALYYACPFLLAYLSIKGWHHSFIWRRMAQHRFAKPTLSRGAHRFDVQQKRVSALEWLCVACLLMALWAIWEVYL